ncbi:uncharacterized protein MONOS_4340 [Monocercomonoides exilis]|uniref:uncharacterized protein n=1 Tax=Monocercomonoides exilis TaxID=2049356 RepID=UPI003559F429|nr:hypothetical protein MONOS_4340 [Monocercomonoides exilis]|eukprot:MONOS_4340.1-p1 / transcript=MONOS_4340.1 / gene=MONOS_4340 / organism=Monocercomonoides_exilis_PA203 / gene_product=unspecified product / transcript_product=unspecified product / location=Mono_scaffold00114:50777-57438(-) / protein_length=2121 / sequence_SO=supercontig / SO=protein_coding / is_pseudo=false
MNLLKVIVAILWKIIHGYCLCEDSTNDKIGIIPNSNILKIIPASGWMTSMETENSSNAKKTHIQVQFNENNSEYDGLEGWSGKWKMKQNNTIESSNTNANRNIITTDGEASYISIHNEKKAYKGIEESKMRSHIILDSSSLLCMNMGIKANGNTSSITLRTESIVMISGCRFEVRSEISPFDLCGSRISLSNLTLRFWNAQQTQMPPLFSTQMSGSKSQSSSYVSIFSSGFSSFQTSSPPFLSSSFVGSVLLTDLIFSNISTVPTHKGIRFDLGCGCCTLMNDCSFSSVCNAYDGGIVPSLNNHLASLTASNTSFVGCCRTRNAECIGTEENKLTPERQNETENGANSFTWCEWNGSRTTGKSDSYTDGISSGGAIFMSNQTNASVSVSHCSFKDCNSFWCGGAIMCFHIKSVEIVNNNFDSCTALNRYGGGVFVFQILSCVRISSCKFQGCTAKSSAGGLYLESFDVSGTGCIGDKNEGGESACVFDCSFTSCSLTSTGGGGMYCYNIPITQFKMRSVQFISCSAAAYGGGLELYPYRQASQNDVIYCCFLFFHECKCSADTPYGHDMVYYDRYNVFKSSNNPFYECDTTNTDDKRVCYGYDYTGSSWSVQHTEKKDWLKRGILNRFVAVSGGGEEELCGANEANACESIGIAVCHSLMQVILSVMLMEGNHQSETMTIEIEAKISILGKGREESVIGTKSLSLSSTTLFSVKSGQLNVQHLGFDHNATRDSSPNVIVETNAISSFVFVVALNQLQMIDVKIENMKMSQLLFVEPSTEESVQGESMLANVTIRNVNQTTEGDGVVMAKSVKEGEIFVMSNTTIENCECEEGNGGRICVYLTGDGEVVVNGRSAIDGCKAENNGGRGGNGGRGERMFVEMERGECGLTIGQNVEFSKVNEDMASYGKDVFVHCGNGVFLESKVNTDTFAFFDTSTIPSDVLKLSGSENGEESGVIPLFVYFHSLETKIIVDGSGGNGMDHNHCGFEGFGCLTVDYCANSRISSTENEMEIISASSIKDEIEFSSFDVSISGRTTSSSSEEMMQVNVSDGASHTQDYLVGCSSSLTMRRLSFVVKGQMKSRRSAFIHSTSTLNISNCSVSFESGALTDGKIGCNVINIEGGVLIVDGFVMESGVTLIMNGKSPISMTNGAQLEILNSRVSGVEVNVAGGSDRRRWGMFECGSEMKGGGMMISVGSGGSLEMKNVNLSECEVPSEDVEDGGKGIGGGVFAELPDQMGSFVLEGMIFSQCNAWKGKNMFVSGWVLRECVNKEHFKWEMSEGELGSLNELYEPLGEGESHIKIVGLGSLRKSISFLSSTLLSITPVVSIDGEREGTDMKVSEGGRNEGKEEGGGMITSNVVASFTNLSFSLPNELGSHSSLIQLLSSSPTSLSILRCSFVCEESTKETKYCLIKADGGSVVIADSTLSQFNLAKGVLEFTPDVEVIDVMNISISNITISESSLMSLSQSSATNMLINNAMENTKQTVKVNSSSFTYITCFDNRACVMSAGSFSCGMECVIEGCVLTKCMSERSLEGGGMKMMMKRGESEVKVSGCLFGMCVCSTGNGRGGGMMIDAFDPNVKHANTKIPSLGLRLENIRFMMNDAFVGKDVFIRCDSIDSQLNERLFELDFSQEALKGENSMCGSDGEGKVDLDLIPLITFYYSAQVFVCVSGSDNRQCGAQNNPCETIGNAVQHIQRTIGNTIWIDEEGMMGEECVIGDVRMVSMRREKATVHFEKKMEERGEERSIMVFVNENVVERCLLVFGEMFESTHKYVVKVKEWRMVMNECSFESLASGMGKRLKNTVVGVEGGEMEMVRCTIRRIHHCGRLVVFCGESLVVMDETKIWDVESEGDVVIVERDARVGVKEVRMENVTIMGEWSVMAMRECGDGNLSNYTFSGCESRREKGGVVLLSSCEDVRIEMCDVCGGVDRTDEERKLMEMNEMNEKEEREERERTCKWNGSMVRIERSKVVMKDTRIRESGKGGLSVNGGSVTIIEGKFENNNPFIEKYPSLRQNIICSDSASLTISSLKGGDGVKDDSSMWVLNDGCTLGGIAGERSSPLFIPRLEEVSVNESGSNIELNFKRSLLLPCDLSFRLIFKTGDVELVETYPFEEDSFVSETEVI